MIFISAILPVLGQPIYCYRLFPDNPLEKIIRVQEVIITDFQHHWFFRLLLKHGLKDIVSFLDQD